MLLRVIAYLLILTTTATNFWRVAYYAGFAANRTELADRFCVNKQRPWLHCNGKCYLANKIKQAEERERKQARARQLMDYVEVMPMLSSTLLIVFAASGSPKQPLCTCHTRTGFLASAKKPPSTNC